MVGAICLKVDCSSVPPSSLRDLGAGGFSDGAKKREVCNYNIMHMYGCCTTSKNNSMDVLHHFRICTQ